MRTSHTNHTPDKYLPLPKQQLAQIKVRWQRPMMPCISFKILLSSNKNAVASPGVWMQGACGWGKDPPSLLVRAVRNKKNCQLRTLKKIAHVAKQRKAFRPLTAHAGKNDYTTSHVTPLFHDISFLMCGTQRKFTGTKQKNWLPQLSLAN